MIMLLKFIMSIYQPILTIIWLFQIIKKVRWVIQFVIFNPWKLPWNWISFYQNSFVASPGLLYHLIRRDYGRLANEAFTSNPIVSLKQWFNGLKITNWISMILLIYFLLIHIIMITGLKLNNWLIQQEKMIKKNLKIYMTFHC